MSTLKELAREIRVLLNSLRDLMITREDLKEFEKINGEVQKQLTLADKVTRGKNLSEGTNPAEVYKNLQSFRIKLDWIDKLRVSI
tara:strand:+ start:82 stop:336 length:255 start_codon:yes stop_codon:yes gene_type:complete